MTTLIPKTTPPFCHEWQRASHWEVVISSSLKELASLSSSASPPSESPSSFSSSDASGEEEGDSTKPPRRACHCAIWLTQVFTRYNLVVNVSRRASIHWSYAITALSITPPTEEEGVDVDGAEEAGRVAISVYGHFGRSWASLRLTDAPLMVPMIEK